MLISVQSLRALAAWVVVFHHFMQVFFNFEAHTPLEHLFADRGAVGVDVFFVISGLVIFLATVDKDLPPWRFMLYRLARIVPAYWFYTLLMALLVIAVPPMFPNDHVVLGHLLKSLLFIPAQSPSGLGVLPLLDVGWTLNFEMLFYFLFAWTLLVRWPYRLVGVAALLFLVCYVGPSLGFIPVFYRSDIVLEFLMGIGIGMLYRRGCCQARPCWALLGIVWALLAIYYWPVSPRGVVWGVPSATLVLSCVTLEPYFNNSRLLKLIGDCSYSVYLIHMLVLSPGRWFAERYGIDPYAILPVCVVLTALAALGSYQWLEKRTYRSLKRRFSVGDQESLSRQNS